MKCPDWSKAWTRLRIGDSLYPSAIPPPPKMVQMCCPQPGAIAERMTGLARGERKEVDKFALIFETEVKEFIMDLIKKK